MFSLEDGQTYDVLDDLDSGDLRVGLHVQAFCRGGSESFVTGPPRLRSRAQCSGPGRLGGRPDRDGSPTPNVDGLIGLQVTEDL